MGYKFHNQCFDTKQEYLDAVAQSCVSAGSGSGALSSFFTTCVSGSENITVQAYLLSSGVAQTPWTYTPQFITCSSDFSDAVSFGWQLALILVAAFGARVIIKALNH